MGAPGRTTLFAPGVYRYRTIDESHAAREERTIERMRAIRARRAPKHREPGLGHHQRSRPNPDSSDLHRPAVAQVIQEYSELGFGAFVRVGGSLKSQLLVL